MEPGGVRGMRDPKQEPQVPADTKNTSEPVEWQTNNRREDAPRNGGDREGRDIETDRQSSEPDPR
jgi:hypothetical protein